MKNKKFIGICQVRVLPPPPPPPPPSNLCILCLAHKMGGKLLFYLCRTCASNGSSQRSSCTHNELERSLIDVYTSIDTERSLSLGYVMLEYKEIILKVVEEYLRFYSEHCKT